jgi:hypothetical protein
MEWWNGSQKRRQVSKARIAGIFDILLTFVTGASALVFAMGRPAASLMATACYVAVTLLFYQLFKAVNRSLSLLGSIFSTISTFHSCDTRCCIRCQ